MHTYKIPSDAPCPSCAAVLNRMDNHEAQKIDIVPAPDGGTAERASSAVVYACPSCEFVGTADTVRERYREIIADARRFRWICE